VQWNQLKQCPYCKTSDPQWWRKNKCWNCIWYAEAESDQFLEERERILLAKHGMLPYSWTDMTDAEIETKTPR
jgi:hypothetical protein